MRRAGVGAAGTGAAAHRRGSRGAAARRRREAREHAQKGRLLLLGLLGRLGDLVEGQGQARRLVHLVSSMPICESAAFLGVWAARPSCGPRFSSISVWKPGRAGPGRAGPGKRPGRSSSSSPTTTPMARSAAAGGCSWPGLSRFEDSIAAGRPLCSVHTRRAKSHVTMRDWRLIVVRKTRPSSSLVHALGGRPPAWPPFEFGRLELTRKLRRFGTAVQTASRANASK